MFTLKHLKTLQHVSIIIQIIFRELVCSLLKLLILKFVKNVKVNVVMRQHNIWCVCVRRTHTHQMLCCRITTLTFIFLTNFKISDFNKEHTISLKMICIRSKHVGTFLSVLIEHFRLMPVPVAARSKT